MFKNFIAVASIFLSITLIDMAICVAEKGVFDRSEQDFSAIIDGMYVVDCPTLTTKGGPWLNSKWTTFDRSIFRERFTRKLFFDYHFYKGKHIPRKYSHLVDEKIKCECGITNQ